MAKYNQLLRIEDDLADEAIYEGKHGSRELFEDGSYRYRHDASCRCIDRRNYDVYYLGNIY